MSKGFDFVRIKAAGEIRRGHVVGLDDQGKARDLGNPRDFSYFGRTDAVGRALHNADKGETVCILIRGEWPAERPPIDSFVRVLGPGEEKDELVLEINKYIFVHYSNDEVLAEFERIRDRYKNPN